MAQISELKYNFRHEQIQQGVDGVIRASIVKKASEIKYLPP